MTDCGCSEVVMCFKHKIATVNLSPYATPSRLRPEHPPARPHNNWEAGVARDARGMPYLDSTGGEVPIKKWHENRHHYEGLLRQRAHKE